MDRSDRRPAALSRNHRGWRCGHESTGGFTLVEVLVALAVLATVMIALIQAGAARVDSVEYLRDRTLATWIASDRITELRLEPHWPDPGVRTGTIEMTSRTWHWRAVITDTPDPDVRRAEVEVGVEPDQAVLARLEGYLGNPEDQSLQEAVP